ncbi:MAG: hypothetical protein CMM84_16135 [Rhodothermaceae bacterium]|nr:hypothetical protein [Rhodothermaceae bacterium]MBC12526.1 hypothetical protein [Rhodothermaceae bacterium]
MQYTAGTQLTTNAAAELTPPDEAVSYVALDNIGANDAQVRFDGGDWVPLRAGDRFERPVGAVASVEVKSKTADEHTNIDFFLD